MPKYQVEVHEIYRHIVTVKADNRDEALRKVQENIKDRSWLWCRQACHKVRAWKYRLGNRMVGGEKGILKIEVYDYP